MKFSNPLISIYITNHNYGRYIEQSIESLLKQSFHDFEIIIIDDGSTDNSRSIIEKYENYDNIRIIYQKNQGLNITNNIAIRVSSGKYIMRLDADDYLDSNALLVMANALEKDDDLGLVFPDYFTIDNDGNILSVEKRHDFNEVTLMDQPAHGACTMIRKSFLEQIGGYDEDFKCQDGYDLWVKFTTKFKVANINTPLFYYRQHGSNLTTNENRILETRQKIKEKFINQTLKKQSYNVVVIPVRGERYNKKSIPFKKIGDSSIIDLKIKAALEAELVNKVIITSPDPDIQDYVQKEFETNKKVLLHRREEHLARLNTGLVETVESSLDILESKNTIDNIIILSLEYPFVGSTNINDAIHTLDIFDADSLISVRPETDMFFQHHGDGMKAILNMEKFTKLEREALFRYTGGLIAVRKKVFEKNRAFIVGKVGHIVIDQKASLKIHSDLDLKMANCINLIRS